MLPFFLTLVILHVTTTTFSSAFHDNNIGQYDCCPLVWKEMLETSTGYVMPPDAIVIGESSPGGNLLYYARIPLELSPDPGFLETPGFGIKSGANDSHLFILKDEGILSYKNDNCVRKLGQSDCLYQMNYKVVILSNPHGCSLGWWKRSIRKKMPDPSSDILFPIVSRGYFARNVTREGVMTGGVLSVDDMYYRTADMANSNNLAVKTTDPGTEVLYINCKDSIKRIFDAQLFAIEYDKDKLLAGKSSTTLQSSSIVNNNDYPQSSEVSLTAEVSHSLQMSTEKSIRNSSSQSSSSSFGKSVSYEMKRQMGIFGAGFSKGSEENHGSSRGSSIESFAMTGQMVMETTTTTYTFQQKVSIPAKSTTTVNIISTPVRGTVSFRSKYRFRYGSTAMRIMSPEATLAALKRVGCIEMDKISLEGEDLILTYEGTLSISTGYDTHVDITWAPFVGSPGNKTIIKHF